MTREVPTWLPAALGAHALEARTQTGERQLSAGDIRISDLAGVRRLVLILDVPDEYAVVVALLSNEFDLTTDQDVLVGRSDGLPYPLVIETDVVGAIPQLQLGRLIRRLPEGLLTDVRRAAVEGAFDAGLDSRRGIPLRSGPDPRRIWRRDGGGTLRFPCGRGRRSSPLHPRRCGSLARCRGRASPSPGGSVERAVGRVRARSTRGGRHHATCASSGGRGTLASRRRSQPFQSNCHQRHW